MTPETIRENYKVLEKILGCKLEIDEFYQKAKAKTEEVRKIAEGKTFAVGQRVDYIPIKAACDLVSIGLDIKFVFVEKIDKADLKYYEWMKEHSPHTKIYLAPDISMRKYMQDPEQVDVAISRILVLKNVENLTTLNLAEEPYDFTTYCQVMDQMIEQLTPKASAVVAKEEIKEENIFARQWKVYPKGVM